MAGANGAAPLTWTELDAYQRNFGAKLTPWESRMLIRLSRTYAHSLRAFVDPRMPPPYVSEADPLGNYRKQQQAAANKPRKKGRR